MKQYQARFFLNRKQRRLMFYLICVQYTKFNFDPGNSFHFRSRIASDVTCELGFTFVDGWFKDFCVEKSGQSSRRRAKQSWFAGIAG